MYIIKLNAIGSTNSFLKEYIKKHEAENFTTVVAENQTDGRGQMGTTWKVEEGKNLTFSIFIKNYIETFETIFDLNCLLTTAILRVLKTYNLPPLTCQMAKRHFVSR
ncbi:hypothetical protein K5I29_02610 [Flavobacterium agricola]|uniref:BPL/LPL catalytic domain-containing protein n=1 Tax=Flavobacterium agricola TaxID=2870839 RepID=A0ABY6M019_9FLAO|nr:hypothetical protein [Flavobacterium agricola]UYW01829.1 hypothetical protein K5I29_02610 [Flavobacterium agricola]